MFTVDDCGLAEFSESQRYHDLQLTEESPNLISVNQLLDSVRQQLCLLKSYGGTSTYNTLLLNIEFN